MANSEHDIVAMLAADLASSRVVAEIDKALEQNQRLRAELLDLRKMAVRRHGEPTEPGPQPEAPAEPQKRAGDRRLVFDGTMASLIMAYRGDPDSPYRQLRYRTRETYDSLMRRIDHDLGSEKIEDLDARRLLRAHEEWSTEGRIAQAHSLIGMVRQLATYGASLLKNKECRELKVTLSEMRFQMAQPRAQPLLVEHVHAIRAKAHEMRLPEIALTQALQFDCQLRQKDVIGEWVPISEPGESDIISGSEKWLRGLRWEEIDSNLILRHVTSKRGMRVEVDLRRAPMVLEELKALYDFDGVSRDKLPSNGPVIIYRQDGKPFHSYQFRRFWRKLANLAGVPKTVMNMDSRTRTTGEDDSDREGDEE
jgi:hypothetical protein